MTRISSMLVLATALAFVSTSLPGASASVLPRQDEPNSSLQAQQTPDYARIARDEQQTDPGSISLSTRDEQQTQPNQGYLTTRDENEQMAADVSNDADEAQWWPCRWGWHWDFNRRRCLRDFPGREGPPYYGGRVSKRDEQAADEAQDADWGRPGKYGGWGGGYKGGYGGGGYYGGGYKGGYGGGYKGGYYGGGYKGRYHKRDELVADEAQREDDWGPGGGRGWGGGYGGGWGGGHHGGGGGGWGGRGRGWSRRDVDDEERGPGGGGRGGGGRGGGGGYHKRDEMEARDEVETRDENTANKANLLPCATGYHLDVLSLQCVPNPPGFC